MSSKKPSCFVIMPYRVRRQDLKKYGNDSKHWNEVYEGLIKPSVEAAGMQPHREDFDFSSRLILPSILKRLESSDVILCDLSSLNPNVFLELGWVLRADKKYVLIKDEITNFQFDLHQVSTYEYNSRIQPSEIDKGIEAIANALISTYEDQEKLYSFFKTYTDKKDNIANSVQFKQTFDGSCRNRRRYEKGSSVKIAEVAGIFPNGIHDLEIDWPTEDFKKCSFLTGWGNWRPKVGDVGKIIYVKRNWAKVDTDLLLLKIGEHGVFIDSNFVGHSL